MRPRDQAAWFCVEGPDGAGKTTLVKELAYLLAHRSAPDRPGRPCVVQAMDYMTQELDYVGKPLEWVKRGLHVVQDRSVLSGPVYEPLIRKDETRLVWLDPLVEEAARRGCLLIFMDADLKLLQERLNDRGDDYVTEDHLADIKMGYDFVVQRWVDAGGAIVRIDTTWDFPSLDEVRMAASTLMAARR